MKVIFATGNQGKLREIRELLGEGTEVFSMREAGFTGEIDECGLTFSENAEIKVRAIGPRADAIVMADDSGLEVRAMNGEPGVFSARFLGENTPQEEKNREILRRLEGLAGQERACRFVCSIAVLFPDGELRITGGVMEGEIAEKPSGEGGFGYDPIFLIPGKGKTVAELSDDEKNALSHRGKALRAAKELILRREGRTE